MLVTNRKTAQRWLISATRFGERADIPCSRCGRTKAPYKGMKADSERFWKERLIMKMMCGFSALSRGREHISRLNL